MLDAAGLTPEERKQAVALFYSRVETLPGTEVTAPANIPEIQPGVIFCLRNELPKTIIDSTYALGPVQKQLRVFMGRWPWVWIVAG